MAPPASLKGIFDASSRKRKDPPQEANVVTHQYPSIQPTAAAPSKYQSPFLAAMKHHEAKRQRIDSEATSQFPETVDEDTGPPEIVNAPKPQGAHMKILELERRLDVIVDWMLVHESDNTLGEPCQCEDGIRSCICYECDYMVPCCEPCFLEAHRAQQFHWAYVWNGDFLEKKDQCKLGRIVTIGHPRTSEFASCVGYQSTCNDKEGEMEGEGEGGREGTSNFTLTHTNGIHELQVFWCKCWHGNSLDHFQMCLQSSILPSSVARPKTGFTWEVMKDFHLHTLTSKKSAYDYIAALERKTDNGFPDDAKDIYRQFARAHRIWIAALAKKRAGLLHGIDDIFPYRRPQSVVVPCFACPQRGFNMPDEEIDGVPEKFIHVVQATKQLDGHFGLSRFAKVDDPDDVSLLPGQGFFPKDDDYQPYINKYGKTAEEKSSCSSFNAVEMQNKLKFKGCVITGVIGVECGRHSLFLSMVDLFKGERFALADYAVARALGATLSVKSSLGAAKYFRRVLITYDIACQFQVNFAKRFRLKAEDVEEMRPFADAVDFVYWLIPKMHLNAHIVDCQYAYALNFFPGAGRTHGEGIEPSWAETKQSGGSTRQMNHGHRHDKLNDFHIFWNWRKVEGQARYLKKHLLKAQEQQQEKVDFFLDSSRTMGKVCVEKWSKMEDVHWVMLQKSLEGAEDQTPLSKWTSPYKLSLKKLPSREEVVRSLEAEELASNNSKMAQWRKRTNPTLEWINLGIELQEKQHQISRQKRGNRHSPEIETARQALRNDFIRFRKLQLADIPALEDLATHVAENTNDIEKEVLWLPSDLMKPSYQRKYKFKLIPTTAGEAPDPFTMALRLKTCGEIERRLRDGQANEAVALLCIVIIHGMVLRDNKNRNAQGVVLNLRSMKYINTVVAKKNTHASAYKHARRCLMLLQGRADNSEDVVYPKLAPEDLQAKNASTFLSLGDSSKTDSWIWTYGALKDLADEQKNEFVTEVKRVRWFRARAEMYRAIEEVEILEQESRCYVRACEKMRDNWTSMASTIPRDTPLKLSVTSGDKSGYVAYAKQKASMFSTMAQRARETFASCGGEWPRETESLGAYLERKRPICVLDWAAEAADSPTEEQRAQLERDIMQSFHGGHEIDKEVN